MTDKFILLIHENFTDTFTLYKHCDDEHSFQSNTVYDAKYSNCLKILGKIF